MVLRVNMVSKIIKKTPASNQLLNPHICWIEIFYWGFSPLAFTDPTPHYKAAMAFILPLKLLLPLHLFIRRYASLSSLKL